ncbi:unnamed protein product [Sphagnum troendelagicum]|uniref:Uncharacterized protein n=3 Tax=Sphagnum TaxID=13804 RepID=A0ABP0VBV0_9BRYO|nr:hypothetical protein BDL97_01G042000 [Sphagnum fallax]
MANITASEIAGFGVGALLLIAALAAPKVDSFVARSQRRSLKLCEECGGVTKLPCLKCKGRGKVTEGFFSALSSEPRESTPCLACKGRGQFPCPSCSKQ